MNLRTFCPSLLVAVALLSSSRAQNASPASPLIVAPDRAAAVYEQNETVTFEYILAPDAAPAPDAEILWTINKDGVPPTTAGQHNNFDLYSHGADGIPGGEGFNADIGNWTTQ